MNTIKFFLFTCWVAFLISCEQSIYVKPTDVSNKINIYSINRADSVAEVAIFKQNNLSGYIEQADKIQFIEDATVEIENLSTGEKETLTPKSRWEKSTYYYYNPNGSDSILVKYYQGTKLLTVGNEYKLTVTRGNRVYTAISKVPNREGLTSVNVLERTAGAQYATNTLSVDYTTLSSELYYETVATYWQRAYMYDSIGLIKDTIDYLHQDKQQFGQGEKDKKHSSGYYFSSYANPNLFLDTVEVDFHLNTYSKEAGKYIESTSYQSGGMGDPFSEPTFLKSNIEGKEASGVFGFYTSSAVIKEKVLWYR
ncbi:MAG: hypothetical protein ACKVTZ_18710 [Bacteroidia bacterium]